MYLHKLLFINGLQRVSAVLVEVFSNSCAGISGTAIGMIYKSIPFGGGANDPAFWRSADRIAIEQFNHHIYYCAVNRGGHFLTLEHVFPFTLGANIGTTVTAMLTSLSTGSLAAVTVAFSHLLFNISGILLIYPLPPIRQIPLNMALGLARLTSKSRIYAVVYVVLAFYLLPLILIFLGR